MGETYRENAYISDLMEKELKAVYDIHLGCGKPEGLMGSGYFGRGGPLKETINSLLVAKLGLVEYVPGVSGMQLDQRHGFSHRQ